MCYNQAIKRVFCCVSLKFLLDSSVRAIKKNSYRGQNVPLFQFLFLEFGVLPLSDDDEMRARGKESERRAGRPPRADGTYFIIPKLLSVS